MNEVWPLLLDSLSWPRWWRGLESVSELERGRPDGVGNRRRFRWRAPLGFALCIDMRLARVEPLHLLAAEASGDAVGLGEWRFHARGPATIAEYEWRVRMGTPRLDRLAGVARPLFAWSHRRLMRRGGLGLGRALGRPVRIEA